jgi:hypothetical protein
LKKVKKGAGCRACMQHATCNMDDATRNQGLSLRD